MYDVNEQYGGYRRFCRPNTEEENQNCFRSRFQTMDDGIRFFNLLPAQFLARITQQHRVGKNFHAHSLSCPATDGGCDALHIRDAGPSEYRRWARK